MVTRAVPEGDFPFLKQEARVHFLNPTVVIVVGIRHCLWHRHRHRHRRCHRRRLRRLRHRAIAGRVCSARSEAACQRARRGLLSSFAG